MALLSGGSEVYAPEEPAKNIPQPRGRRHHQPTITGPGRESRADAARKSFHLAGSPTTEDHDQVLLLVCASSTGTGQLRSRSVRGPDGTSLHRLASRMHELLKPLSTLTAQFGFDRDHGQKHCVAISNRDRRQLSGPSGPDPSARPPDANRINRAMHAGRYPI